MNPCTGRSLQFLFETVPRTTVGRTLNHQLQSARFYVQITRRFALSNAKCSIQLGLYRLPADKPNFSLRDARSSEVRASGEHVRGPAVVNLWYICAAVCPLTINGGCHQRLMRQITQCAELPPHIISWAIMCRQRVVGVTVSHLT